MHNFKRPFTLVEILTVVVIITIIVGVSVPAFNRLMTGSAVSYGSRLLSSQLNMARTEACARRKWVAVVFLTANEIDTTSTNKNIQKNIYNLRTFRSCYVTYSAAGTYTFGGWVPGTKWEQLPKGCFFFMGTKTNSSSKNISFVSSGTVQNGTLATDKKVTYEETSDNRILGSTVTNFDQVIVFKPNGRPALSGTTAPQVGIFEGSVISNTMGKTAEPPQKNLENYYVCRINRYTGAITTTFP